MTLHRPQLIVTQPERIRGLGSTTQEQRKRMTVPELIALMGPLHVHHADYKPRAHTSLCKPENLAGKQSVISHTDASILGQFKAAFLWVLK